MFQRQSIRHLTRLASRQASRRPIVCNIHAFHATASTAQQIPKETAAVIYERHGGYDNVLKKSTLPLPQQLGPNQVLVKMLAAPINPADINMVEGNYGQLPPELPAIGGNEGVGQVIKAGHATSLTESQWVIPARAGLGTWREYMVVEESDLLPISSSIPMEYAATIAVNPSTAYRLLNDFVELQEGDVIVQNGASSMVGMAVIQLAHQRGIKTINIIRDRPDHEVTIDVLKKLGGDVVVPESYANTKEMRRLVSDLPKAKLALNCVGGDSTRKLASLLEFGGTMVTYGGLSRKPITLPTAPFIFNDIVCRGFWMTRWTEQHSREERAEMIDNLVDMIQNKKLVLFMETHKFANFDTALQTAMNPPHDQKRKVVLKFD